MKIYTRQGDKGETGLFGGKRVPKNSLQVECYGTVDEANSVMGLARSLVETERIGEIIAHLQEELFVVGAELASTEEGVAKLKTRVDNHSVSRLEEYIDEMEGLYPPQKKFVVPGGSPGAGALDLARTVVRRGERLVISLNQEQGVRSELIQYLNRLSDLLYVMARAEAHGALVRQVKEEVLKVMGQGKLVEGEVQGMNLQLAKRIIAAAETKAVQIGVPMVITVVDSGGNLVAMERQDEALLASIDIAQNKAFTAVALKMPTEKVAGLVQPGQPLYGLEQTNQGKIVVFGGGVPLWQGNQLIGAIGVSGGSVEEDIEVAQAGVEAVS